jgi:ankyrin repeat protein
VNVVDKQGLTPLHYAALVENAAMFQQLTGWSAKPGSATWEGASSYHTTIVRFNGFKAAQMLLQHGADPKAKSKAGQTPLDLCLNSQTRELLAKAVKAASGK